MTRQEYLMDRYEDALFSLMMDKVATQEGEKALLELERLQKEASINVPETLHRKCLKTISRYFARKRAKAARHTVSNVISKIAIVALVGILTFTIAFAASPTFRSNTMNLVMKLFDDHAEFRFEEVSVDAANSNIIVNWLPDGYSQIDAYADDSFTTYVYERNNLEYIYVSYYTNESTANLDVENMTCTQINISGNDAQLIKDTTTNTIQIIWQINNTSAFVQVLGENISVDDIIHIANSIAIE